MNPSRFCNSLFKLSIYETYVIQCRQFDQSRHNIIVILVTRTSLATHWWMPESCCLVMHFPYYDPSHTYLPGDPLVDAGELLLSHALHAEGQVAHHHIHHARPDSVNNWPDSVNNWPDSVNNWPDSVDNWYDSVNNWPDSVNDEMGLIRRVSSYRSQKTFLNVP